MPLWHQKSPKKVCKCNFLEGRVMILIQWLTTLSVNFGYKDKTIFFLHLNSTFCSKLFVTLPNHPDTHWTTHEGNLKECKGDGMSNLNLDVYFLAS